jgi:NAD(P)-dependent dehydrogenase (short-subunit alcohol dehydrogenase family)
MNMGLSGKVIVVTGAASGIGLAAARLASGEGAGALLLTDRDALGLQKAAIEMGAVCEVESVIADLSDAAAPSAIAAAAKARFGRIDGLVNAAGLTTRGSFITGTNAIWDELFAVNARAAFFLMQEAINDMRARKAPGAIVNILSVNAPCGIPELAVYSATKGALSTLTRNAANAHMPERIRVNGINLGWVATQSEQRMQAQTLGRGPGWLAAAEASMPLERLVTAEEAARLIVFLLGDGSIPMSGAVVDFEQRVGCAIG